MKIVQSFWSYKSSLTDEGFGWISPEYHLMSWALSSLQLTKYYKDVELYTDSVGYEFLIKKLNLPYSKVHVVLDSLNSYDRNLWALPKILTYSLQKTPFLHIDGDVFIWAPFDTDLLQKQFIVQNLEMATDYYNSMMAVLEKELVFFPAEILNDRQSKEPILAYNAGIIGGRDVDFFKKFKNKAFEFVDRNNKALSNIDINNFNIFFEQYLFYCLLKSEGLSASCMIKDVIEDNGYKGFADFQSVPFEKTYLHLIGNFKRDEKTCKMLEGRLMYDYPEYYERVINLFPEKYKRSISVLKSSCNINRVVFQSELKRDYLNKNLIKQSSNGLTCKEIKRESKIFFRSEEFYFNLTGSLLINKENITIEELEVKIQSAENADLKDCFEYERLLVLSKENRNTYLDSYLYARDLVNTSSFQELFGHEKNEIFTKKIIKSPSINILKVLNDWTFIRSYSDFVQLKKELFDEHYVAFIPEVGPTEIREILIDGLDKLLLDLLNKEKVIGDLLEDISDSFGKKELLESYDEFEFLIFQRLKKLISNKCIEMVKNEYKEILIT